MAAIRVVGRWALAVVLIVVAVLSPFLGFGSAEYYEGRTFLWVLESDWLVAAGLLAGVASAAAGVRLVRPRSLR